MKRILSLFLALALVFSLSACKEGIPSSNVDTSSLTTQTENETESTNSTSTEKDKFVEPEDYTVVLQLTINPQFKIYLDKNYKVIMINPVNDDAKAVVDDYRLIVDDTFETVIDTLISKGKDKGYVQRNSPIYIDVLYKDEKTVTTEDFNNRLKNLTTQMSQKYSAIVKFDTPNDASSSTPSHTHKYSAATCTEPQECSCGETKGSALGHKWKNATCESPQKCFCGATKGKKLGHTYVEGVCSRCKAKDPDYVKKYDTYINGTGYDLGTELTVDVILTTKDIEIDACPCVILYKKVNNKWEYADWPNLSFGKYYALSPTMGEAIETDTAIPGRWDWVTNSGYKKGDTIPANDLFNKIVIDTDFSKGKVIRKFDLKLEEKGEYKIVVKDGEKASQNDNKYTNSLSLKIYK